jgi:hypothetical protein
VRYLSIFFEIKDLDRTNPVSDEVVADTAATTEEAGSESQIGPIHMGLQTSPKKFGGRFKRRV